MNKAEILENIFNTLLEKGTVSEKADILGDEPMEDKVYTKRLIVGGDIKSNGVELVYVSVTSGNDDFSDASVTNMRINTKNAYNKWVNFFATELDKSFLTIIYETVCV